MLCCCCPAQKPFDGAMYNANGSPYAMQFGDASVFDRPYKESPVASQFIAKTMDKVRDGSKPVWLSIAQGWF